MCFPYNIIDDRILSAAQKKGFANGYQKNKVYRNDDLGALYLIKAIRNIFNVWKSQ